MSGSASHDLETWLGRTFRDCPCGREHAVGLSRVLLRPGAADDVADMLPPPADLRGPTLVIADPDTWDAAGSRVSRRLAVAGHTVREALTKREPHADDETLDALRPALSVQPGAVVAVGAGTMNDLGKVIADEAGINLYTVATAASMNGYASTIAALTIRGLKVTRPAPSARGLVLDTQVLAAAPPRLTAAGFGDLMSRPVSGADWVLASELAGEVLCPTALGLADDAVQRARASSAAVGRCEPEAIRVLAEALVLSGLAMVFAGSSSPASGGEHLLSHYLDMSSAAWGRRQHLHGEQVAVGTRVSRALYKTLRANGPPAAAAPGPPGESVAELRRLHAHLPAAAVDELLVEAQAKDALRPDRLARRRDLALRWDEIWARLDRQLVLGAGTDDDLRLAGTPTRFRDIEVTTDQARQLVRIARHMRRRYTVLDLAADLGALDEFAETITAND